MNLWRMFTVWGSFLTVEYNLYIRTLLKTQKPTGDFFHFPTGRQTGSIWVVSCWVGLWPNLPIVHSKWAQRPMYSIEQPFEQLTDQGLPLKGFISPGFVLGFPSQSCPTETGAGVVGFCCTFPLPSPPTHTHFFLSQVLLFPSDLFISPLLHWNLSLFFVGVKETNTNTSPKTKWLIGIRQCIHIHIGERHVGTLWDSDSQQPTLWC